MLHHYRRRLFGCLLGVLWTYAPGVMAQNLADLLKPFESTDSLTHINAKTALKQYLENSSETARPALFQTLITALPSQTAPVKNGVASTLDSLDFFWTATHQDEAEKILYDLYQAETEGTLKNLLDRALMRAKGLYRDANYDYSHDKVSPTVEAKFQRVYKTYPKSKYAPAAHFFLGEYYLRAYAVLTRQNRPPLPVLADFVQKSNQVFQDLLGQIGSVYTPPIDHALDAHYFRALNFVLLNQVTAAIAELKLIEEDQSDEEKIYVGHFFYSIIWGGPQSNAVPNADPHLVEARDLVDKFFDGKKLAAYTRKYLEENQSLDFKKVENLRKFAEYLQLYKE